MIGVGGGGGRRHFTSTSHRGDHKSPVSSAGSGIFVPVSELLFIFKSFKVQFFNYFSQNDLLFTSKTTFQQIILFVLVVWQLQLWLTKENNGKMLVQEDSS